MARKITIMFLIAALIQGSLFAQSTHSVDFTKFVNTFTGTGNMGHTYPGASAPFGMVQLSPDTDTIGYELNGKYNPDVYKYCAGYKYSDKTIVGFSHTHFSGTGHSDLGDILIMPVTGNLQLNPGTSDHPEKGYRSQFSHENEYAEPGYYRVKLDDTGIIAELTATVRTGMHRYTFPAKDTANIILDLIHGIYNYEGKNVWSQIRVENDSTITGYRQTNGWARTRVQYFAIKFSKPFIKYGLKNFDKKSVYRGFWRKFNQEENFPELAASNIRAYFTFNVEKNEKIQVKVALSSVSTENALNNMEEIPDWNFDRVFENTKESWNKNLGKINAEFMSVNDKKNFYTALYHTMLSPTIYSDSDRSYKGLDGNIHKSTDSLNFTTFSLWDTYRALHPLFNIIQPQLSVQMINSMLDHYNQSVHKMLPVWSHHANENWCMIGYHAVSVIADAAVKGVYTKNLDKALEACIQTSNTDYYDGIGYYKKYGYIPEDLNSNSVSKTLEYAYDDWAIAQLAKKAGREEICLEYSKRAENFKNVYDPSTGFMRAKLSDGSFKKDFDPLDTHNQGFIEGNSWNYSLYVPHMPYELIKLTGGNKRFVQHLDSLFTMELPDKYFENTEDITREGIMGNYVHGNEPSHHVAYLFNYAGESWRTQKYIRKILIDKYRPEFDGLSGNDDCGQMSAWYIFSSLGFYPVAPGSEDYSIGSPLILNAQILLDNNKEFKIIATNQSGKNIYVQKIIMNGKELTRPIIKHSDITGGGVLEFVMGPVANKKLFQTLK